MSGFFKPCDKAAANAESHIIRNMLPVRSEWKILLSIPIRCGLPHLPFLSIHSISFFMHAAFPQAC